MTPQMMNTLIGNKTAPSVNKFGNSEVRYRNCSALAVQASVTARLGGSVLSGLTEIALFHPVDTVAKRLMSNQQKLPVGQIIFKDAANAPLRAKWASLFPGIGFGAAYKILQRTYKYAGQLYVRDWIQQNDGGFFHRKFGEKVGTGLQHATAGSIIGIGEIVLLPLDVLKIKAQTNPESLRGRGVMEIFQNEGMSLYRGAGWTAARNGPGSFALFGGASAARTMMGVSDGQAPTWTQSFVSSMTGAFFSLTVSAPLDVIKTRIQNKNFGEAVSGTRVISDLLKHEGPGALFKGLTPKMLVVGPKLVFSFTVAQKMIASIDSFMRASPRA